MYDFPGGHVKVTALESAPRALHSHQKRSGGLSVPPRIELHGQRHRQLIQLGRIREFPRELRQRLPHPQSALLDPEPEDLRESPLPVGAALGETVGNRVLGLEGSGRIPGRQRRDRDVLIQRPGFSVVGGAHSEDLVRPEGHSHGGDLLSLLSESRQKASARPVRQILQGGLSQGPRLRK